MFFGTEEPHATLYGRAAVAEYLDGTPGRLMRSLKSLLGSSLIDDTTAIGDRNVAYRDVVTLYLRTLRERAAAASGPRFDAVVMGRPVRFVDDDAARDRAAQDTLAACARAAGFRARRVPARADRRGARLRANRRRARRPCWSSTSAAARPTSP